jgi:hypothetical protein
MHAAMPAELLCCRHVGESVAGALGGHVHGVVCAAGLADKAQHIYRATSRTCG